MMTGGYSSIVGISAYYKRIGASG